MTINQIDESATRQRAIVDALEDCGELMKPSQLAKTTGLEPSNVRQAVREMLDAGLLWQPKYGKYGLPEWKPVNEETPEPNANGSTQSDLFKESAVLTDDELAGLPKGTIRVFTDTDRKIVGYVTLNAEFVWLDPEITEAATLKRAIGYIPTGKANLKT